MSALNYTKALALFGSGLLTGASLGTGVLTVPALRPSNTPPGTLRQQWADLYDTGKLWFPPGAILTTAAFAQIAWITRQSGGAWKPWVVAAASSFATIPFTVLVMMGGIKELRVCEESKVPHLVKKWNRQNWVRAGFYAVGFGAAVWAVCV